MFKKSTLPRWRYLFNCRNCAHTERVDDDSHNRHGNYCIPMIESYDKYGAGAWSFVVDNDMRTLTCSHYAPFSDIQVELDGRRVNHD